MNPDSKGEMLIRTDMSGSTRLVSKRRSPQVSQPRHMAEACAGG